MSGGSVGSSGEVLEAVGRSGKGLSFCWEVRKGVECLVGGHVMVGGSVGR